MKKSEFYGTFKGTGFQALSMGGTVKVPSKISAKAEIIIAKMANANKGWNFTLCQLQEAIFAQRGEKAHWDNSGSFSSKDLLTLTDIRQAIVEVYFHKQDFDLWKGSMLALVAAKNGELMIEKVGYIPDFFKEKAEGKTEETDENEKTEETKINGLLEDLKALLNRKGSAYTADEVNLLKDAIYRAQMAVLDAIIPA